jgi:hypothetical protein
MTAIIASQQLRKHATVGAVARLRKNFSCVLYALPSRTEGLDIRCEQALGRMES